MDGTTFVLELIEALAWPIVVLMLALLLKKPLCSLIPGLAQLKYRDLELKFSEGVARLEDAAPADVSAIEQSKHETMPLAESLNRFSQLISLSPRSAVMDAWRILELELVKAASTTSQERSARTRTPHQLAEFARNEGLIDDDAVHYLNALNRLRNQAAHSPDFDISAVDARRYVHNAWQLAAYISSRAQDRRNRESSDGPGE